LELHLILLLFLYLFCGLPKCIWLSSYISYILIHYPKTCSSVLNSYTHINLRTGLKYVSS
jgi:hypothetical protein